MEIVGRDVELETIGRWLDESAPGGLVLEGEAGIGKTTLWVAGVELARARGYRVLSSSAAQTETRLSHTALRDLLDAAFDEIADELPEPQRQALSVVLLRERPRATPPDTGAICVAALSAFRALASRGPTAVAIDDVQWLDDESAQALRYAFRRLEAHGLARWLAIRAGHENPIARDEQSNTLLVDGLSVGALGRILHERGLTFARPTLRRIHEISGGNTFYAVEVARALDDAPAATPGAPLPIPGSLHELVDDRIGAIPAPSRGALSLASALSRPTLEVLAKALGVDPGDLLETPEVRPIARVEDGLVSFAHPLYAAAVYDLATPVERDEMHRLLARAVDDPEERARHLALAASGPDELVAADLEMGAHAAFSRGSPAAAAELAARARILTPADDTDAADRRAVMEVDYAFAAGDTDLAASLLESLIDRAESGPQRAQLLSRQARLVHFGQNISASVALLRQALDESGEDAQLRAEIEEGLAWGLLLVRDDLEAASAHAQAAVRAAERGDPAQLAESLAVAALADLVRGREWRATMDRALAHEEATLGLRTLRHPTFALGYCLSCADELADARAAFLDLEQRARQKGDEASLPSIFNHLALIECLADHWELAGGYAADGYERAVESGQRPTQASILAKRALLAARRGDEERARSLAADSLAAAGHAPGEPLEPTEVMARGGETAVWSLGFLELSLGNHNAAHAVLEPLIDALVAAGVREPGEIRCLPDEIEALISLGAFDRARELVELYEEWAGRLERPSVRGTALRSRGLLAGALGTDDALEALEGAAALHAETPMPFERGRTLLALGAQQRRERRRRDARGTLTAALETFEELGARLWAARARADLGRIGGRAPADDGLTPTEERVAALVAQGKANKEVAAELVVSVHTVEAALTSIYRKLDVRSRTELTRRLTEETKH